MIDITCLADLHGHFPDDLPGGDILIIAGDCTNNDSASSWDEFYVWLDSQPYVEKIVIAGNHDNNIDINAINCLWGCIYLCDSGAEIRPIDKQGKRRSLKVWGSPWSSQFPGINPKCCAFTRPFTVSLKDRWDLIPDDVDILITHTPPWGILDDVPGKGSVGDMDLRNALDDRIKPKLHVFGHIHAHGGQELIFKREGYGCENNTICVNAAIMDEVYDPVHKPVRIEL